MLRRSLQHICASPEIEEALENVGLPATVSAKNGVYFITIVYYLIILTYLLVVTFRKLRY